MLYSLSCQVKLLGNILACLKYARTSIRSFRASGLNIPEQRAFVGDSAFTVCVGKVSPLAQKLVDTTEEALYEGISKMVAGNHIGDVSSAVQKYAESRGFHVTREYTGHGVGRAMHEGPQVPNYGEPGRGLVLRIGMTIALEPMLLVGTPATRVLPDQWTVSSADGSLTAHYEHTVAVTENGPLILTTLGDGSIPRRITEVKV